MMELRLAALASAAQANHKALAQGTMTPLTRPISSQRKTRDVSTDRGSAMHSLSFIIINQVSPQSFQLKSRIILVN